MTDRNENNFKLQKPAAYALAIFGFSEHVL